MSVITYPRPDGAPQSDWSVSVNGEPTWTHYTTRGSTATVSSDTGDPVVIDITAPEQVNTVDVAHQQPGVWPSPDVDVSASGGRVIRITLPPSYLGNLLVSINDARPPDWDRYLSVGVLPVETDEPEPDEVTYYFGPGVHTGSTIGLRSGDTVYVAGGAYVNRRFVTGAFNGQRHQIQDVRIFGRGVIDTNNGYGPKDQGLGTADFYGVDGLTIEGITYVSRYAWAMASYLCESVTGNWLRLYSCEIPDAADYAGQGTPDGWDMVGCQSVFVENSFLSVSDDTIATKGDKYGAIGDSSGLTYRDLLLMQGGKSNGFDIGYENGTRTVSGVTYQRIVLAVCWRDTEPYRTSPLGIHVPSGATIEDVLYEDIDIRSVDGKDFGLFVGTWYSTSLSYSQPGNENRGTIRNIVYRRVSWPAGVPPFRIASEAPDKRINVTFEDCTLGGEPLVEALPGWEIVNADVEFTTSPPPEPPPSDELEERVAALEATVAGLVTDNAAMLDRIEALEATNDALGSALQSAADTLT